MEDPSEQLTSTVEVGVYDTENMDDPEMMPDESASSPRKRGSPLKFSSDNPQRGKKQKRNKQKPQDGPVDEEKENNGRSRRPSPSSSSSRRRKTNEPSRASAKGYFDDRNINPPNKPAEAGVITKIYVENFMW